MQTMTTTNSNNATKGTTIGSHRRSRWLRAALVGALGAATLGTPAMAFELPPINPNTPPIVVPVCERDPAPDFCFPDYSAFVSATWAWPSVYNGVSARAFYVTVRNEAIANPGALWTAVGIDQGNIIAVEPVWGNAQVEAAPVAEFDTEALWTIEHLNGLDQGEYSVVRVWVDTYDAVDISVQTNWHAGVEYFGNTDHLGYRHDERNHSNNVGTAYG